MAADPSTPGKSGSSSSDMTTPSGKSGTAAPAEKPGMTSMPHHVTGSVVSVDKKANSVSIKDSKGKEMTLVADTETAPELSRLKTGDEVKVTYKKDKNDQPVATKIDMARASTSKSPTTK
jgi:Cu/Ag efflux protein CusF